MKAMLGFLRRDHGGDHTALAVADQADAALVDVGAGLQVGDAGLNSVAKSAVVAFSTSPVEPPTVRSSTRSTAIPRRVR